MYLGEIVENGIMNGLSHIFLYTIACRHGSFIVCENSQSHTHTLLIEKVLVLPALDRDRSVVVIERVAVSNRGVCSDMLLSLDRCGHAMSRYPQSNIHFLWVRDVSQRTRHLHLGSVFFFFFVSLIVQDDP